MDANKAENIWGVSLHDRGGFGDPFERGPERLREDVGNELVPLEETKEEYGVVIDPVTIEVDARATEGLRKARKR